MYFIVAYNVNIERSEKVRTDKRKYTMQILNERVENIDKIAKEKDRSRQYLVGVAIEEYCKRESEKK